MIGEIHNNVLIGRDKNLFLYQGKQFQFDYLTSKKIVDTTSINNFSSNLKERVEYFAEREIIYRHVVFPSKPLVKKDFLPHSYQNVESIFIKYYKDALGSFLSHVIYPLDVLNEAEKSVSTFDTFNTHNSHFGYLTIFNHLMKQLHLQELDSSLYDITEKELSGDLCVMLGVENKHIEKIITLKNKKYLNAFNNKAFLPRNTNEIFILTNLKAKHKKRLLIFGDSFFIGMLNLLQVYFSDILFVRSALIHKDIVDRFKPDIVFTGNIERYLSSVKSDRESHDILLALYGKPDYHPSQVFLSALKAQLSYGYYKSTYDQWLNNIIYSHENLEVRIEELAAAFDKENDAETANKIRMQQDTLLISLNIDNCKEKPDMLREMALVFEQINDIKTAKTLMETALRLRPNGPFIQQKVDFYNSLLII